MDGLTHYRVSLYWHDEPVVFDCWAEDEGHAIEQAENAYPDGSILVVERI